MLPFSKIKISKTPVSSLSDAQTGGGLLSCASRLSRPPQGEDLRLGHRLLSQVSSDSERAGGKTRVRVRAACMPACLLLACSEACSCQSLPFLSHRPGPATRSQGPQGSIRGGEPTEACGSLRTPPVSARVCLDVETADEESRLPGRVLEENEGPTGEGKPKANTEPPVTCADPSPFSRSRAAQKEAPEVCVRCVMCIGDGLWRCCQAGQAVPGQL